MVKYTTNILAYCLVIFAVYQATSFPVFTSNSVPKRLKVSLAEDVRKNWNSSQGTYILNSSQVNGKPHWLQENGSDAIWYSKTVTRWLLGREADLGQSFGKLRSSTTQDNLPHDVTPWEQNQGYAWTPTNDTHIVALDEDIFNVVNWLSDLDNGVWNNPKTSCKNWYGWNSQARGTLNTLFNGKGKGELDFGNCGTDGYVRVYMDGTEIASAGPGESKVVQFDYNDGTKLAIHEIDGIIQVNSLLDLNIYESFLGQNEDLMNILRELKNLPVKERLKIMKKRGIDVLEKVIEMSKKALEEIDNLIEKSDAAMQKLRTSYSFLNSETQNIVAKLSTEFNDKQLKLIKARQELVSLAKSTVIFCNDIEISIDNWKEEYAAIIYKSQYKQLRIFIENTKKKLSAAKNEYYNVISFYMKMEDKLDVWETQVVKAKEKNIKEYEKTQSELQKTKHNLKSWRIGLIFADIFGCLGFCSTLVYDAKEEANDKIEKSIKEYEDEMKKMTKKVKDAIHTVKGLENNYDEVLKILKYEVLLITTWETAADSLDQTIDNLSEASLEDVKIPYFKNLFSSSIKTLKKAAKAYLDFVNLDK